MKSKNIPIEVLALYDKLVATIHGAERKGDTMPYTSINGHMFSYISKEGNFVLRLPNEEIDAFIKKYKTHLNEAYGIIQKEYVVVPSKLFRNTKELQPYFEMSYEYVSSLKPKPTKKSVKK